MIFIIRSLKNCGPVNVLLTLIQNLDRTKFRPIVVTLKPEKSSTRKNDFQKENVDIYLNNNIFQGLRCVVRLCRTRNIAVIHSHGFIADVLNYLIRFKKIKRISTIHNYPFEDYVMSFGKFFGKMLANLQVFIEQNLNGVSCSKTIQSKLWLRNGLKTECVRNGIPIIDNKVITSKVDTDVIHFIYIGNISELKNVKFLVESFTKMNNEKLFLDVVGEGSLLTELRQKYNTNNVKFWGYQNDVTHLLEKSNYFISASLSEGMPLAVLEAVTCGLPVVLSDIESHIEIIRLGSFGNVFKNNSFDSFKLTIDKTIKDYNEIGVREKLSTEARDTFSGKKMARLYEAIYVGE